MTPDEIRALYVETLAQSRSGFNDYYWHVIGPTARAEHCREVEPDVDALAQAGLLPVATEYGAAIAGADEYTNDPEKWCAVFGGPPAETLGYSHPIQRLVCAWQRREVSE